MIRIRALNEESSEESEGEEDIPAITREAQEQTAFAQYNEALGMLREKNFDGARKIFQELLESTFLVEIKKKEGTEGLGHPGLVLKYSSLKNMGTILERQGDLKGALHYYLQAVELDGSDVSLWYRVGTVATLVIDYELACDAFLEGLRCSPRHWPCLDNLVTILYVLNDYIPCLLYIARAFELDSEFLKGLAFRDKILSEQPSIIQDFNLYCKGYDLGQLDTEYDNETAKELIQEALEMREKKRKLYSDVFTPKPLEKIALVRPLSAKTWLALGESLVQLHRYIETSEKIRHFCCPVDLETTVGMVDEEEKDDKPKDEAMDVDQAPIEEIGTGLNEEVPSLVPPEEDGAADITGTPEGEDSKSRKRRRSSLSFLEQWMWGGKRRSARVRSTAKREAEREDLNLEGTLRRLVPPSLLPNVMKSEKRKELEGMKSTDDSLDTMDLYKLFERRESTEGRSDDNQHSTTMSPSREKEEVTKVLTEEGYFGTEKENKDVEEFIKSNTKHDIIDILVNYMKFLSTKWQLCWPVAQPAVFLQAYQCMRQHVNHPSAFSSDEDLDWLKEDAYITLLYGELFLDRWLQNKMATNHKKELVPSFDDHIPAESIGQLVFVSVREGLFQGEHLQFMLRLYWLKAHLFLNQGSAEIAMESLHMILQYIKERCDKDNVVKVFLPNCKHYNNISMEVTQKLLTTLKRNQNLYEVQHLYDEQNYEDLIEILQETFHYSQQSQLPPALNTNDDSCPDRPTQLAMLMDALWHLKRYQDCFYWGEACCNEALHKYLNSEEKEQSKWASTVEKLLSGLESCINKAGPEVIDNMPNSRLARLIQNLTHTVCHQMDAPETAVEMPIESISPWILLQQILQRVEEKGKSRSSSDEEEFHPNPESTELPGYITVLFTAHDFLGKRSWCCSSEGALLLHTMDIVIPKLKDKKFILVRDKLIQGLEQVFYCLYAHPNKKTKAKYLQDHGVPQIPLTWERGMQLYQFYLPQELAEFDSYRVISITADVESLFKRIAGLIPAHCNPAHLVEKVVAYIDGSSPSLPVLGDARTQLPRSISAIYYLLADHYFKNNEWGKAIRHYLLDVCVNPVRIDSWAGMALARGSQLETKLNSCEPLKSEMEFLRQASAAQRCFQRSVDIEANHSLMWIEFGSFVYMVHSFCSRLLKQETDCLSLEMFEILETRKENMLDIAVKCFTSASKIWYAAGEDSGIQDERWLHQYMLGKVAEKRDHDPSVYLNHFSKASEHLHENKAVYARKISYNNPQNLAVEALEVYYRIHACILKYLEQNEGKKLEKDMKILFEKLLKEAAEGPFMASNAKDTEGKTESDEERRKRPQVESLDDVFDDVFVKKAHLDLPLDICVMEDVIDVMENLISKVVDTESKRMQPQSSMKTSDVLKSTNVTTTPLDSNKDENITEIKTDDCGAKKLETPNQISMQSDPVNVDTKNTETKKEPLTEIGVREVIIQPLGNDRIDTFDDIDLAMEVVEEIVMDDGMVDDDDEMDEVGVMESIGDKVATESEKEVKKLDTPNDVQHENDPKIDLNENKSLQLVGSKADTSEENGDGNDGDDEHDDDDYDGDDDEEQEGRKHNKKIKLAECNTAKPDVENMKMPENIQKTEQVKPMIPRRVTKNRRHSSEESTTTTTMTEESTTSNSSSSSSDSEDDSTSSNDSSNSSSSSDSDNSSDSNSDDAVQGPETGGNTAAKKKTKVTTASKEEDIKKKANGEEDDEKDNQDHYNLVRRCLVALEECLLRFPQHYKSLYRLTHYYFYSKFHRNVLKCQDLLLGTYKCLSLEGRPSNARFQGLFAERKNNNFFNGVWRIPVSEIDRPGSFASHMSRCVLLLMEVLREVRDHRMLLELCLQLKRIPDADKKYLRDSERDQLCRQALTLALQALRAKLREGPVTGGLVLEMYRAYQRVQRHLPQKESVFGSLLCEAYKQHAKLDTTGLDQAIRFCQQQIIANRTPANPVSTVSSSSSTPSQPINALSTTTTTATTTVSTTQQQRKVVTPLIKPVVTSVPSIQFPPRSRGRPPNVSRVSGNVTSVSSKSQSAGRITVSKVSSPQLGSIIPPNLSSAAASALNYFPFHNLFSDPSLITAAVQSKLPSIYDPQVAAMNFLNLHAHVGGYQAEFLRHFANTTGNISTPVIPNISTSQPQKSPGAGRSNNNNNVSPTKPTNPQTSQISTSSLPSSISITPIPPSQTSVPCNTSTYTSASTKYGKINTKSVPSLQQKLQASQILAKAANSRSTVLNLSSSGKAGTTNQTTSLLKTNSQKPTSVIQSQKPTSVIQSQKPTSVIQSPLTKSTSYTTPKDHALFSSQTPKSTPNPFASLLKGGEGMLTPGVSITQVTAAAANTTTSSKSSTSKLMSFRKHAISLLQGNQNQDQSKDIAAASRIQNSGIVQESSLYKTAQDTSKNVKPVMPRSQISENKGSGASITKNKSPENKDSPISNIYKNQSGMKGSRSPASSTASFKNIGHEITVTPSVTQPTNTLVSSMSMLSRLQEQSTDLQVVAKPKPATLDLPMTIPSSITITPRQHGPPDGNFSRGQQGKQSPIGNESFRSNTKKFKDTVSITEVARKPATGNQAANVTSGNQAAKKIAGPNVSKQEKQKQDDKPGGSGVEIITLE